MSSSIVTLCKIRNLNDNETAPPQVIVILNNMPLGENVSRETLAKNLEGKIATKQPIERIIAYYQPALEKAGVITVDRASKKINVVSRKEA